MKRWDKKIIKLVDEQRLLIITPFGKSITRITSETAMQRNKLIAEISDELFIPHSNKDGIIYPKFVNRYIFLMTAIRKNIA